jgi:hypothetical protein
MSELDRFRRQKANVAEAEAFVALLADGRIVNLAIDMNIKPRTSEAVRIPRALKDAVEEIAQSRLDNVLALAVAAMRVELNQIGQAAKAEYEQLAADAGLVVGPDPNPVP